MKQTRFVLMLFLAVGVLSTAGAQMKSIQEFGVLPTNTPSVNAKNLQKAIDCATRSGAA